MSSFPPSIQNLINQFSKLPGLGPKTAERLVFYLLKQPKEILTNFSQVLNNLKDKITICDICQSYTENSPCAICQDKKRDQGAICLVAEPQDLAAIESTGEFNGVYYVLGGVLNPAEGITPQDLNIKQLISRIKASQNEPDEEFNRLTPNLDIYRSEGSQNIKEIILALNPTIEGESTSLYLIKLLKPYKIKITRLGRGLPMGGDLKYADEVTLASAFKGRTLV